MLNQLDIIEISDNLHLYLTCFALKVILNFIFIQKWGLSTPLSLIKIEKMEPPEGFEPSAC